MPKPNKLLMKRALPRNDGKDGMDGMDGIEGGGR